MNEVDTPRFFLTLRTALTQTKALFTTLTGWSFYYMCYGGEIGYDLANGYKYGIPVSGKPYGGSSYGWDQWMVDSTDALGTPNWGSGVKYIRENVSSTPYWWGKNWIGELFPDSVYTSQWAVNGNLNSGTTTGSGIFIRTLRSKINCNLPTGTTFLNASSTTQATKRRTYREGCTSFFNYESSGKQFHHQGVDNTYGTLTAAGNDMAVTYFFPLPSSAPISRPFNLNLGGTSEYPTGNEWSYTTDYPRFTAKTMETFYLHSNGNLGSALIGLRPDTTKSAYVVVSGIDRTTESGTPFIAKYSLISLIHGFLTAGYNNWDASGNTSPLVVHELPCIKIKEPTGITELKRPTTITVRWGIQWRRWDGQPYTASHSSGYGGENDESDLRYTACYSTDSGVTWKFMVDDSANSNSGYLPTNSTYVLEDETSGADESFDWDVSDTTKFPEGSYLIRIEAFRNSLKLHYAWHMERIFIDRR
jgi:hypothetical protein